MTEGKVFQLDDLRSKLEKEGGYFLDFLKAGSLEAGLIVLRPDQKDTQGPHPADELYYVIAGSGTMELGKKKLRVGKGSVVYVPAGLAHRFYGNDETLVVLYVFGPEE